MNFHLKKQFLSSLLIAIFVWISVGFLFFYTNQRKADISNVLSDIEVRSFRKDEIKLLSKQIETIGYKSEKIENLILGTKQDSLVEFIESIESMGVSSKVELDIKSIEVLDASVGSLPQGFELVKLKIETKGNLSNLFYFLNLVENLPKRVDIEQVSFSLLTLNREKESDGLMAWVGNFVFTTPKIK